MPLVKTRGAASAQGFGEFAQVTAVNYIEDVFSTFLYTGTGAAQTITNGIDLSGKGGLTWIKGMSGATAHALYDTARGATFDLVSNTTAAQTTQATGLTAFGSTGFSIGALAKLNTSAATYVSWSFRKQPKFFDIVTWSGDSIVGRTIPHNLGSTPGCIIVKTKNNTVNWAVWHRSGTQSNRYGAILNTTAAYTDTLLQLWGTTGGIPAMTSASFSVGDAGSTNDTGNDYVAYLFAHDAGGFGLTGTDNVISCGSYTGNGNVTTGPVINLGYEPQWVMIKNASAVSNWTIADNMRGFTVGNGIGVLRPNTTDTNFANTGYLSITSTGFTTTTNNADINASGNTYIYVAIRRGPMKVPTVGTTVFSPNATTNDSTAVTTNFPVDLMIEAKISSSTYQAAVGARLIGGSAGLVTSNTNAEYTGGSALFGNTAFFANNTGVAPAAYGSGTSVILWNYRRAPSFMDVVCYTGTGANATQTHNLAAVPEMMIVKKRSGVANWAVYHSALGAAGYILLNTTAASTGSSTFWQSTTPTSTSFFTGTNGNVGDSGLTYVAYLFATCAGVSKVFSYTGNGSSQTINCGFTAGSRWVMIKRTDSTGDWYVWDSARGIIAGNDPHLSLNTTAAEVTTDDSVDTDNTGFIVNQLSATNINVTSATYIGLAIA